MAADDARTDAVGGQATGDGDHASVPSCRPPIQERLRERVVTTFPRCGKCDDCKFEESILDKLIPREHGVRMDVVPMTPLRPVRECSFCGAPCAEPLDRVCRACAEAKGPTASDERSDRG